MKLKNYHICARTGDMETSGLSMKGSSVPKKSVIADAVCSAMPLHFSPRIIISLLSCSVPGLVFAAPEGGNVVAGSATISSPNSNTTLITQSTKRTAIDWQRFNIGKNEHVKFVQPGSNSVALNRVVGGDPSKILGNLSANGQVFLVNPNGIYFGQSVTVDVGGLVASVHNISNQDFMSGNYVFSKADGAPADTGVVNDGVITARDGGYVVLIGDYVHNNGVINARLGTVALAAGKQITMDVKGNGLVSVVVDEASLSDKAGIKNSGDIIAAGGRVILTAKVANDLIDTAINNEGLIVANGIAERDGVIFLTAAGGDIVNSGTLDASAEDGSNVDGGGVLVYTDKNIFNTGNIIATGDGSGDGGVVRVIAEERMDHALGAQIDVTSDDGKGGFVELSGYGSLAIRGDVNLGTGGSLVIDPANLRITNSNSSPVSTTGSTGSVGKGFIETQLDANANVTLVAASSITSAPGSLGSTTSAFTISATGTGNLSIINGIVVSGGGTFAACSLTGVCLTGGTNSVVQGATGDINLGGVTINITGDLNVAAGSLSGNVGLGSVSAGNVNITGGGSVNVGDVNAAGSASLSGGNVQVSNVIAVNNVTLSGGSVSAGNISGSNVSINAGGLIALGNVNAGNQASLSGGTVSVGSITAGDVIVNATGTATIGTIIAGNNVSVTAGANLNLNGLITLSGSSLFASASNDLFLTGGIGTAGAVVDADVSLNAANNVNVDADIFLGSNNLILAADSDGDGVGDVNINGSATEERNVNTQDSITITGEDFNVVGATLSAGGANALRAVTINADNSVTVNISGQMKVQGGNAVGTDSVNRDVSVSVTAGNDVSINAQSLSVLGGTAIAIASSVDSSTASVSANAKITAGNDITIALSGALSVIGGMATASASGSGSTVNATAKANADAVLFAGDNLVVSSVIGDMNVIGGQAISRVKPGTGCDTCSAAATAKASLGAQNIVISGVTGDINVAVSTATANVSAGTSSSAFNIVRAISKADTMATINAVQDITITNSGRLTVRAGNAAVSGNWSSAQNVDAKALADSKISADNISITTGTGFNLLGGTAAASPTTAGATNGTASAQAVAAIVATGNAEVNVTGGSILIAQGSGASGSTGVAPVRIAYADADFYIGGSLKLIASDNVIGVGADIMADALYVEAGNNIDLLTSTVTIGNGTVSGVSGDAGALAFLDSIGITPPSTSNPNAKFSAGGALTLGTLTMTGDVPYLWLEADSMDLQGLSLPSASDVVVQFSPFTASNDIGVEESPDNSQAVNYNNVEDFSVLPGTTIIIGSSAQTGNINIGSFGNLNLGSKNIVFVSSSNISDIGNVNTSGIVAEIGSGVAISPPPILTRDEFVTPVLTEVDVGMIPVGDPRDEKERKKNLIKDDEEDIKMCEAG